MKAAAGVRRMVAILCVMAFISPSVPAVTLTNDTVIDPLDTTYDGQDIIVSNATLTVDGEHSFASLRVEAGGILTHTPAPTGTLALTNHFADEPQLLTGTNDVTLANSNVIAATVVVTDTSGTFTFTNEVDYIVTVLSGEGFVRRTETSAIPDGAMVLVSYDVAAGTTPGGLRLTVTNELTIAAGGAIQASGRGYTAASSIGRGFSSGSPSSGGGGGNAGIGGFGSTNSTGGAAITGSFQQPSTFGGAGGSGVGGAGGTGGGVVLLNCGGTFTLDGTISANGANATNNRAGGGAGGSVWIVTTNFAGAGSISANGGAGEPVLGGGGGGGRISVNASTNGFTGALCATGGVGWRNGGAGTVFVLSTSASLVVDNGGLAGTNTPLGQITLNAESDVAILGGAVAELTSSSTLANLTVGSNSTLRGAGLQVTVTGDVWVQSGGAIHTDRLGYSQNTGPGLGRPFNDAGLRPCSGGGHGGQGGNSSAPQAYGGVSYGSQSSPTQWGSGGGGTSTSVGGSGGGYVRLNVTGDLTVDGRISADGQNGSGTGGGGGSGGSVWLSAGTLAGTGLISAIGGDGVQPAGGGGGGGRIHLIMATNLFEGSVVAMGGGGFNPGGSGTIVQEPAGQIRLLLLDNGGRTAGNARTPLQSLSSANLLVRSGAVASVGSGSLSFLNLTIESNSWFTVASNGSSPVALSLNVTSNMFVYAGGGMTTDGLGYAGNLGIGRGNYAWIYNSPNLGTYVGSGGGHGGFGGNSISNAVSGGLANGLATSPNFAGSGGGGVQSSQGGAGGGLILLSVGRTLMLDGIISANGTNGINGGGGGAGGGIRLTVNTLMGLGQITAHGGDGFGELGGGGGGGRIQVIYQGSPQHKTNANVQISAYGGGGAFRGGAGTIVVGTSSGSLLCDNGGHRGARTPVDGGFSGEIDVRNGAVAAHLANQSANYRNLLVRSNAAFISVATNIAQTISVASNVVVEAGGAISWDGLGTSTGGGSPFSYGGGGHGGFGGNNSHSYGNAYGSAIAPATPGAVGGRNSDFPTSQAGLGGGALRLNVNGILHLDGELTARGRTGVQGNSPGLGGGSGGSLWLSLNRFTGTGLISADGGDGLGTGGGGGGGRIAVTWNPTLVGNSNLTLFTGSITARGGSGVQAGGAGTVYLKRNDETVARLLVDNGGLFGTNTPIGSAYGMPTTWFDFTAANGAQPFVTSTLLNLNNLNINPGSMLTLASLQSTLTLNCRSNATIAAGAVVSADGRGFGRGLGGVQAGATLSSKGAGGGHAGNGGASATGAAGGGTAGAETQPTTLGGGGGAGANSYTGGCEGGGAIRLLVPGTLTLDGLVSASGNAGIQDDSGGGAGGSIWVTAGALAGNGVFAADGGDGELYGGGGGGGGRIAVYANNTNAFSGGFSVLGGDGASAGENGTVVYTNVLALEITGHSPNGVVSNVVGYVDFNFSSLLSAASVTTGAFTLIPPAGSPMPQLSATLNGSATARLSFNPFLNAPGNYAVIVTTALEDIFGATMSQSYTGAFTVVVPEIQGHVRDTNGTGIAGVTVQTPAFLPAITDADGFYSLGVPPGWSGSIAPSLDANMFVPGAIVLSNVTETVTNQNFVMVDTIMPVIASEVSGANLLLNWSGLSGVMYQPWWSSNLIDWQAWDAPMDGTNGPMQFVIPISLEGQGYFRIRASN